MTQSFEALGLHPSLLEAVTGLGFEKATPIQAQTLPLLISQPTDLLALAQTGTGKTAAFGLPLIQRIMENPGQRAIVLAPTRELCNQIANDLKAYARLVRDVQITAVYGGASIRDQLRELARGPRIVVGTPGRTLDMIRRGALDLSSIAMAVLDEADEMLNMGFLEEIEEILSHTPDDKLVWLFSATMPKPIEKLANRFMEKPARVEAGSVNQSVDLLEHFFCRINGHHRYQALSRIIDLNPDLYGIVFCNTKREVDQVATHLVKDGYTAEALHGDLTQAARDRVMEAFRAKKVRLLVATDVAARGIDVDNLTHVIHYQLPDDWENYTHRSGRTARAGRKGMAIALVAGNESGRLQNIKRNTALHITPMPIPTGDEIVRKRLEHFVAEIGDQYTPEDLSTIQWPALPEKLQHLSAEEVFHLFLNWRFKEMVTGYQNAPDLNQTPPKAGAPRDASRPGNALRMFVNLGEMDGFDWKSLRSLVSDLTQIPADQITDVSLTKTAGFFNIPAGRKEWVYDQMAGMKFKGRRIRVDVDERGGPSEGSAPRKSFKPGGFRKDGPPNKKYGNKKARW
jgi:ATP-dependent RNA helicase DeaD